jgi:hypothetical protein
VDPPYKITLFKYGPLESADKVQQWLLSFTNRYTEFDDELKDYRHISYFWNIKKRLGV